MRSEKSHQHEIRNTLTSCDTVGIVGAENLFDKKIINNNVITVSNKGLEVLLSIVILLIVYRGDSKFN